MNKTKMGSSPIVLYLSHGGGPLPLLDDPGHVEMVASLETIASKLAKPSAIVVISAHWEADKATITHAVQPPLIYDYYGFPEESYQIQYPAPGAPHLGEAVFSQLRNLGVDAALDDQRGFDHGLFVPLKIMYPQADIPCIQLSLTNSLDPSEHIKIGGALAGLEQQDLLIIGSGFSFHNMKAFFAPTTPESQLNNHLFEKWLIDTCSNKDIDEVERVSRLENWQAVPAARYCHPREEHLLPLHVCYGAARRACREVFVQTIMGKKASAYLW